MRKPTDHARMAWPSLSGEVTPGHVAQARKDLGRQLAAWRDAARLTQVELARRSCYSRSAVANVEIGRQNITRRFWQCADTEVGARGALLAAFDQVDALARDFQVQTAQAREHERQQRAARYAPTPAPAPATAPDVCGCGLTVGRWTGRETRALREALRMSVRAFAEHLGVTTATVPGWESRAAPAPPRLATQAVLDQALKLADVDAKARFGLILASLPDGTFRPGIGEARRVARGSTVTPLRRQERTPTASLNPSTPTAGMGKGAAMHPPIPTLHGTPTHVTAVELYQGHHGGAVPVGLDLHALHEDGQGGGVLNAAVLRSRRVGELIEQSRRAATWDTEIKAAKAAPTPRQSRRGRPADRGDDFIAEVAALYCQAKALGGEPTHRRPLRHRPRPDRRRPRPALGVRGLSRSLGLGGAASG
jgi:transcriptional regulator with XRE-family HTH domain